ncbi:Protein DMP [Arabidopsis suecica]|uniref:Protein DMP n=1 Tax=Arabidopsis suecica TaxID=45249 RepID=A0A8T2F9M7_ARASU|nr:Protein DMP [Arabidopsis suecica]
MSETSLLIPKTNSPASSENMANTNKTLTGLESLIKLLPTGTLFIYLLLNPVLTNDGECSTGNKVMSSILVALCSFSCVFSCFTDSFKGVDGSRKFGIVTKKGLWTYAEPGSVDLSKYKLRIADFVHAGFVLAVFGTLVLLDANTASCFYPRFRETQKTLVMALPPAVGVASATIFALFPSKRSGIGYAPIAEEVGAEEETKKASVSA